MLKVLLFKAHVKGYVRKDGAQVRPHERKGGRPEGDWRDEENWHSRTMAKMKTLPDSALRFIIKDANEAAENMEKMGSTKAGKYRDEAHYASMELTRRRKQGSR